MSERKPEALIGIFVKQLNAALADENAALIAENERLQAALRAARVVVEAEGARATLVIVDAALAGKEGE